MAPVEKKRKTFTLSKKLEIIREVEKGGKKGDVAKIHNITPSTLSTILSNKQKILDEWTKHGSISKRMKVRQSNYAEVDQALLLWFTQQRSFKASINGPMLQEKARQFAKDLGVKGFIGSNGFIDTFRARYGIAFKGISDKSVSASREGAEEWLKNVFPHLVENYVPDDIYNADETSLFYECLPSRTQAFKGDTCFGGTKSKVRFTVLFCTNMSGSDKRRLLVIGKSTKPRCFKNLDVNKLPVEYISNNNAWMTGELWNKWLAAFDNCMTKSNRKVLLIVDNVSSHHCVSTSTLKAVKLVFLPPNTMSLVQPCDQGIIRSFKVHYRSSLTRRLILLIEAQQDVSKLKINILEAINLCSNAWKNVSPETIRHCFSKAGFVKEDMLDVNQNDEDSEREYMALFAQIQGSINTTPEEYLTIDDQVLVEDVLTDEQIIQLVRDKNTDILCSDDEENEVQPAPSLKDAVQCIETLRLFCLLKGLSTDALNKLEEEMAGQILIHKQTINNKKNNLKNE